MAPDRALEHQPEVVAVAQIQRVVDDGAQNNAHLLRLLSQNDVRLGPDLADAVHLLCALHGRYPGLITISARQCPDDQREWFAAAERAFEIERAFLLRLTAAVGPLPGTPGAAETEASLVAMRHALDTLARSERSGCALGAACALIADWQPIRGLLDRAASRCGFDGPACALPSAAPLVEIIGAAARSPAVARALAFGSEQMLLQHRALFSLLEARSEARETL